MDGDKLFTIIVIGFVGWAVLEMHSCSVEHDTPEYKAKQEAELKDARTPKLVSSVNGIELYVVRPDGYTPVYFSKSGTHTTHTERHGKAAVTVNDDVSNAE